MINNPEIRCVEFSLKSVGPFLRMKQTGEFETVSGEPIVQRFQLTSWHPHGTISKEIGVSAYLYHYEYNKIDYWLADIVLFDHRAGNWGVIETYHLEFPGGVYDGAYNRQLEILFKCCLVREPKWPRMIKGG